MLLGYHNQIHIPIQSAIESKVCLLGVYGIIISVIHRNNKGILLFQMFGQLHPEGRIAPLMLRQLFSVQIDNSGHSCAKDFQIDFVPGFRLVQFPDIPASSPVVVIATVLSV